MSLQRQNLLVNKIELSNYRNYNHLELDFYGKSAVFTGENGSGKTNILEALSLLYPGKGLRSANNLDLNNFQTPDPWWMKANITGLYGNTEIINSELFSNKKRIVSINSSPSKSKNELAEIFCVIWLTPQMDHIFISGGSEKRKFYDRLVYNFDSAHASRVTKYEYFMRERNKILKDHNQDEIWLSIIEKKMSEVGVNIITTRLNAATELNRIIAASNTAFPQAIIKINGELESKFSELSTLELELYFVDMLKNARKQDSILGRTSIGPHKSDITIFHKQKQQYAEFCSTGEQKALLVMLILADARARIELTNTIPILLLDEVVAHLDEVRKTSLFAELDNLKCQYFITGVNHNDFNELKYKDIHYLVNNGKVSII